LTVAGRFRDFLPNARICKPLRNHKSLFFSASALFRTDFHFPTSHLSRKQEHFLHANHCFHARPVIFHSSACLSGQSQALYRLVNGSEQFPWDRHLRHLKDDLTGVAHDLCPDLDQLLPQRRQRPVTRRSGQHRLPQEICVIAGTVIGWITVAAKKMREQTPGL
jgi:hypothetical protein